MKRFLLFPLLGAFLLAVCPVSAYIHAPKEEPEPEITAPAKWRADEFAFAVFRDLVAETEGNVVFSPASLETVLRMLHEGAAGATRVELETLPLGDTGVQSAMQVKSADALFVAEDLKLKPTAAQDVRRVPFGTDTAAASEAINAWCREQTQGTIPALVEPHNISDTRLMTVNAVYLREEWLRPFEAEFTEKAKFHLRDGRTVKVPMMYQENDFRYAKGKDWEAVALMYSMKGRQGTPGCFIAILPKGDARKFAATLTPKKFNTIRRKLLKVGHNVTLYFPKMTLDTPTLDLKDVLIKQGVDKAFQPGQADFSRFADEPLHLGHVFQRCHIVVDEKATEASVASGGCDESEEGATIEFNRPFIWIIGDLTTASAPYFMGLFEQP